MCGFNSRHAVTVYALSEIEQLLSSKERQEIISRLANYHIPLQILQLVAEECNCSEVIAGRREMHGRNKTPSLIAGLNDKSLLQLREIFLDCRDSLSNFRLAVFLSSKFGPFSYKFVMAKKVRGKSNFEYIPDVCVYSRTTGDLIAVGIQNNNAEKRPSNAESLRKFLVTVGDIAAEHHNMLHAYYASSYGYDCDPSRFGAKNQKAGIDGKLEIKFLEFRDSVYLSA